MKPLSECRLYAFVDTAWLRGRSPELLARQLCEGGADLIQLRAKGASLDQVRSLADQILPVTQQAGVGLVINDHASLAAQAGAELCHLGQEDFFDHGFTHVSQVRNLNPPLPKTPEPLRIGLSTHQPAQAQRALAAGADYLAVGPVYPTTTKPTAAPVTLEYVRWAAANIPIPWFAIGGITLQNLEDVIAAGATRVCVVSAILNAQDVAAQCRKFAQRLTELD